MIDPVSQSLIEQSREIAGVGGDQCICHRCIRENNLLFPEIGWRLDMAIMILCPECGNKRCPKASDHRLDCTRSNLSGQPGSIYDEDNP